MPLVKSRGMGREISVCQGNELRGPGSSSIDDEMAERGGRSRGFVLMCEGKVAV